MFQRILVPLDGSLRAEQALPVAARIARATGGSVFLLEVVSLPMDYSGGLAPVAPLLGEQIESDMAVATDYLKTIAASPLMEGIATRTEVSFGLPAQYIIAAAEESDQVKTKRLLKINRKSVNSADRPPESPKGAIIRDTDQAAIGQDVYFHAVLNSALESKNVMSFLLGQFPCD